MRKWKQRKRKILSALLIVCTAIVLAACGSSSGQSAAYTQEQENKTSDTTSSVSDSVTGNRKQVKEVSLSAETEEFTKTDETIRSAAKDAGGYVEYSSLSNYRSARSESITIRIPAESLDAFIKTIEDACSVTQKKEQAEDITDAYNETESELDSLKTEVDSLNGMLEKAESVEDSISIQNRLSEVRSRISTLEAQKKSYDSEIAYSTVSISLAEAQVAIGSTKTVGERISYGFRSTLHAVGTFFVELFIFLIAASPALAVIAAVVFLVLFFVKRSNRKKVQRRQADYASRPVSPGHGYPSYDGMNHPLQNAGNHPVQDGGVPPVRDSSRK
jgi:hypothetical protein